MDINSLRAFLTVAETASFSLAATELQLTQPAVSKRIAALERELGIRMFDRIGHRVVLTEAGQALLPRARRILLDVEDTQRRIANLSGEVAGPLRLGTSHHIGLHRLPPVLKRFVQAHPAVRLDIEFQESEAICAAVEDGSVEVGIVTLPLNPPATLELRKVWDDPLSVVVAPEHPLGERKRVRLTDLSAHPAVLPPANTFTRQLIEAAAAEHNLEIDCVLSTHYLETIKMLVAVGLGWSLLPDTMLDPSLRRLAVGGLAPQRSLGVIRHPDRTLSNAARALIDIVVET